MKTLLVYFVGLLTFVAAKNLHDEKFLETSTSFSIQDPMALFMKNDILEVPEEIVQLTGVSSPSEEEWIAIINNVRVGLMPKYMAEKNYTLEANQTGTFNSSDGVAGIWSAMSYINYIANETNANVSMISVDLFPVDGHNTSTGSLTRSYYTKSEGEIFWDTMKQSWTFNVDINGTHNLVGNASSYSNGRFEMTSIDTSKFFVMSTDLSNVTNNFTITFSHTNGNGTYGKEQSFLAGSSNLTSMPLNVSQSAANDPFNTPLVSMIQGQFKQYEKSHSIVDFTGNYTVGEQGDYNLATNGTVLSSSNPSTSSSNLHGHYSLVKSVFDTKQQNPLNGPYLVLNLPRVISD